MIVKDEEKNISACLESVRDFVDEIIVVDTGSSDRTKDIAGSFGAKVFDFEWCDDFSAARNFSISKANGDWILVLDADERISLIDLKKIEDLVKDESVNGYKFVQRNYYNEEKPIKWRSSEGDSYEESKKFLGWQFRGIIRLFRNKKGVKFEYPIHETVFNNIKGKVVNSEIPMHHFGKSKGEFYYKLLEKKIKEFPTAHSFAEMAIHCFEIGKNREGKKYRDEAIKLNKDMKFLEKFK